MPLGVGWQIRNETEQNRSGTKHQIEIKAEKKGTKTITFKEIINESLPLTTSSI